MVAQLTATEAIMTDTKPDEKALAVPAAKATKVAKAKAKAPAHEYDWTALDKQFQRIIQQLKMTPGLEQPLVMGIASAVRGEGRTTVALGMATAIAQMIPLPVVVLEADLEHPTLAKDMNLVNNGLSEFLRGEREWDDAIQPTAKADLMVIAAGDGQSNPMELLRSERLTFLIALLSQHFAAIIVDLPPLSSVGEAARIINQLDQVLMVVEAGSTPAPLVKNYMELVPQEKIAGVILNRTRPAFGLNHWVKRLLS